MKLQKDYLRTDILEPGLLRLFRSYVVVINVLSILNLFFQHHGQPQPFTLISIVNLVALAFLDFVVFNPPLEKRLQANTLALGIFLFLVMTALQFWSSIKIEAPQELIDWGRLYFTNCFVWLFIPMLITAWQYGLRGSVAFVTIASIFEGMVFILSVSIAENWFFFPFVVFRSTNLLVVGAVIARLMVEQRKQRSELKAANQQLSHYAGTLEQLSTSRERNRLARELHDTLAHTLSGVSVQLEAVRTLWEPSPDKAHELLVQALHDTRDGLSETRRALKDLRAEPLEDLGLLLAIENLCADLETKTGADVDLNLPKSIDTASAVIQHCIYRTVQESFANIDRHAGAKQVRLSLSVDGRDAEKTYQLTIQDNGQGFDTAADVEAGHFGLRGMRERVELLNGAFLVTSAPNAGTLVSVTLKEVQ
jgi:signal transduction histidine kinase